MARADAKWMPLYIADYLQDTQHLTRAQHGSYLLLLVAYWTRGGPLPDNDTLLSQIAKCSLREWRNDKPILAGLFKVGAGLWVQTRADKEIAKASAITKAKAEAGAKGAAKRWHDHGSANGKQIAEPSPSQCQTDAPLPLPLPSHSPIGEKNSLANARESAKPKSHRLPDDWKPDEKTLERGRELGLTDAETIGELSPGGPFFDHFQSPECDRPLRPGWDLSARKWLTRGASQLIARRSRGLGQTARQSQPRQSVIAARDSILAKAGLQPRGNAETLRDGEAVHSDRTSAGEGNSHRVIEADGWREVPGPADGIEEPDAPVAGLDGGPGSPACSVPETLHGIPGGCGEARALDAAGVQPVVAGVGGTEGAAGDSHLPPANDASGSDDDYGVIPAFLRRTA